MPKLRIEKGPAPLWLRALIPIIIIVLTFLITSLLILWADADPFEAYYNFLILPLSKKTSAIEVLVKATPLILTGATAAFAFSAGYWNIGGEGQLLAGAAVGAWVGMTLTDVSPYLGIPMMIIGGIIGGVLWALGPALLKIKLDVDEVVTTLLLNSVIVYIVSYLLNGPWRNPESFWPQTQEIDPGTMFFKLIPKSRLHFGFIISIIVIFIIWFILSRTPLGLRMRSIGLGKEAAKFAGVNINRTILITALVSGGIAGLAGSGEIAGIHFHLVEAISENIGYNGIIVAMLAGLNPIAIIPAALFMGLIDTGAQTVSRVLGVPVYLGNVVQATLLLVTLSSLLLQNYRIKRS